MTEHRREKVIKGLECCAEDCVDGCPYEDLDVEGWNCTTLLCRDALELLKAQEPITGETSDGYHTFNELYHHRAVLFSVIVANYPDKAWKSKKHHDGTMYNGMFIVGIDTPDGQATYHYDVDPYWDMFKCRVLDNAPEWDGHTPAQAIERIGKLKAQEPRVMTPADVNNIGPEDVCAFIEIREEAHMYACYMHQYDETHTEIMCNVPDMPMKLQNGCARLWTSRPTDEQRKKTPWKGRWREK